MRDKIKEEQALIRQVHQCKAAGKTTVFTNGCFDLLHVGHVRYLEEAKKLGDVLIVAVNSDRSTQRLKGPSRPINTERERTEVLAALTCVDYVTIFDDLDPYRIVSVLKPDVLVKGGDWTRETTIGRDVVEKEGGKVVVIPYVEGASTTHIIQRILKKCRSVQKRGTRQWR